MDFLSPQLLFTLASLFAIAGVVLVRPWVGLVILIFGGALGRLARFPEVNWDVMDVVGVLTGWSALLYLLINRRQFRASPLDLPILVLAATVLANLPRAADEYALSGGLRFLAILLVYFIAVQMLDTDRKVHIALVAVLCAAGLVGAFSIAVLGAGGGLFSLFGNVVQFSYETGEGARVGGPFGQPNALAQVTALAVPIGLALALGATGLRQWLWVSLAGIAALCTLLTQSRSAIVGMVIGAAVVAASARVRLRTALSAGLVLLLFGYVVSTRLESQELFLRFDRLGVAGEFRSETGLSRLRIARASLQVFAENPMGTGFGSDVKSVGRELGVSGLSSHNALLRFAVELGIPGLLAGLWLVYRQVRVLWEVSRRGTTPAWRMLGAACLGAVACVWFHNMFHDTIQSGYVWLFFATASAVSLQGLRAPTPAYMEMAARSVAQA